MEQLQTDTGINPATVPNKTWILGRRHLYLGRCWPKDSERLKDGRISIVDSFAVPGRSLCLWLRLIILARGFVERKGVRLYDSIASFFETHTMEPWWCCGGWPKVSNNALSATSRGQSNGRYVDIVEQREELLEPTCPFELRLATCL